MLLAVPQNPSLLVTAIVLDDGEDAAIGLGGIHGNPSGHREVFLGKQVPELAKVVGQDNPVILPVKH